MNKVKITGLWSYPIEGNLISVQNNLAIANSLEAFKWKKLQQFTINLNNQI